jgi:hypothetical protein
MKISDPLTHRKKQHTLQLEITWALALFNIKKQLEITFKNHMVRPL